jgi:hypothetical protein
MTSKTTIRAGRNDLGVLGGSSGAIWSGVATQQYYCDSRFLDSAGHIAARSVPGLAARTRISTEKLMDMLCGTNGRAAPIPSPLAMDPPSARIEPPGRRRRRLTARENRWSLEPVGIEIPAEDNQH